MAPTDDLPLACDLTVFTSAQRARHDALSRIVLGRRQAVRELDDGYAFELPAETYFDAAEFIRLEHLCCPFFRLMLEIPPGQPEAIWLHLRGSSQIKAFLQEDMGLPNLLP